LCNNQELCMYACIYLCLYTVSMVEINVGVRISVYGCVIVSSDTLQCKLSY
jgi:hypothetical protein